MAVHVVQCKVQWLLNCEIRCYHWLVPSRLSVSEGAGVDWCKPMKQGMIGRKKGNDSRT